MAFLCFVAAWIREGKPATGEQLQPEVEKFMGWVEGLIDLDLLSLPNEEYEILLAMRRELGR